MIKKDKAEIAVSVAKDRICFQCSYSVNLFQIVVLCQSGLTVLEIKLYIQELDFSWLNLFYVVLCNSWL